MINTHCYRKDSAVNGRCNEVAWWDKKGLANLRTRIFEVTSFLSTETPINVRLYHITNNISDIPRCSREGCTNPVKWQVSTTSYSERCSPKCTALEHRKFGSENNFSRSAVKNKINATNLLRYGAENYALTSEFTDRMKHRHSIMSEADKNMIQRKRVATNLDKYGTTTPLLNDSVQQKIKETLIEKYGVDSPLKSPDILRKVAATTMGRYGCDMSDELANNRTDLVWLADQLAQYSVNTIAEMHGVSYGTILKIYAAAGYDFTTTSSFEQGIVNCVRSISNTTVVTNDRSVLSGKEIDIYLPELNLGIECDGVYWHGEANGKDRHYHLGKTTAALAAGVKLIHVFDTDWKHKQNIVVNRLKVILNNTCGLHGRKCHLVRVSVSAEREFLQDNHLQGYTHSAVCYGLVHNDELVMLMSFGKSRYNKKYEWELMRLATKGNYVVHGGAHKLFKRFTDEIGPESIISYCDRRWFTGEIYRRLRFSFLHNAAPNYFYLEADGSLSSRVTYQKHKLSRMLGTFDPALTEWENMKANGYDRIWDCGNSVWVWDKYKQ